MQPRKGRNPDGVFSEFGCGDECVELWICELYSCYFVSFVQDFTSDLLSASEPGRWRTVYLLRS